jgi:hypothetical protein
VTEPIVLVTTSSEAQDDGRLVQAALDALAGEPPRGTGLRGPLRARPA